MLSTLREFFRIDASSASLFEGLNISRQKQFCAEHMNAYPTLFLSPSFQNADTFEQALNGIRFKVTQLLDTMLELMESDKISPAQREQIQTLYAPNADETLLRHSLLILTQALERHYGRRVVVLIDEYDMPLENAFQCGFYEQMVRFLRDLMGSALKTNASLAFARAALRNHQLF